MPLIVELELWSRPGVVLEQVEGKELAERCARETGLCDSVVLGLSYVPDQTDIENLALAFASGELSEADFQEYCLSRNLDADPTNARTACDYLVYKKGQPLAWLHFPADGVGLEMARTLIDWAASNGFQIRDGSSTYEPLSTEEIAARWSQ